MAPPLSSDIIDYVFTSLPDFATLLSAILVSKSFHETYQAHPSSILTSVAETQIGPELLPCATRLAHFNRDEYLTSRANYVQDFPSERKFSRNEAPGVTPYVATLARNDSIMAELELFFSTTCKDGKTGTRSLLSPRESLRFRRGLYRWWLMTSLFPPCYLQPAPTAGEIAGDEGNDTDDENDDDTDDDTDDGDDHGNNNDSDGDDAGTDTPDAYIGKSHDMRRKFLCEFSDDEVAEMWQVHNFMLFASGSAWRAIPSPAMYEYILFWNGPSTTVEILRTLRTFDQPKNYLTEPLNWDQRYFDTSWPGFLIYLQEKNYDTSKVGNKSWDTVQGQNVILDSGIEDTEECDECHVRLGPQMWSSSNWHLLPCAITSHDVHRGLPGHLGWNPQETRPLADTPWAYPLFVDRYVSPGTPDWSEDKLLCKECVLKLMGRRILNRLRELKYMPQLEDCWYGYQCRTQRKPEHAAKLNHLCDPTRGD